MKDVPDGNMLLKHFLFTNDFRISCMGKVNRTASHVIKMNFDTHFQQV